MAKLKFKDLSTIPEKNNRMSFSEKYRKKLKLYLKISIVLNVLTIGTIIWLIIKN